MDIRQIIRMVGAVLVAMCFLSCSKSPIPPNAHVQDLGVLKLKANTPKQLPLTADVSLYCVGSRPEQLPQKVEFFATVTNSSDHTLLLDVEVVPTPSDYKRLWLKRLTVPFHSGEPYEFKVGENEWVRFIPTLDAH